MRSTGDHGGTGMRLARFGVVERPALSNSWKTEVRRRCVEVDQGAVTLRPAATVFAKAFANIRKAMALRLEHGAGVVR